MARSQPWMRAELCVQGGDMQFLTVSRRIAEKVPDGDLGSLTEAEFERARVLYSQSFIRQIWHRGDIPGACLIVEAESEQQVRETLRTLPFFEAGMLDVLIIPLRPYTGFAPHAPNRSLEASENGDNTWNSATV